MCLDGSVQVPSRHLSNLDQILPVSLGSNARYLTFSAHSDYSTSDCLIDYPSNTVPLQVTRLFKAQLYHDQKQRFTRMAVPSAQREKLGAPIDYLRPIIADADTGHGGLTAVMKLTKMFVEAGAAGIHIEDQARELVDMINVG